MVTILSEGSTRIGFVARQVWGSAIERGDVRLRTRGGEVEPGWQEVEAYWAVPNLASARFLVARNRRVAIRSLWEYGRLRSPRARAARGAAAALAATGLPLSRDVVAIDVRDGAPPTTAQALGELMGYERVVPSLGVRVSANAKPTLELRLPGGPAVGFAKLGWSPATKLAVRNEAEMLRRVAGTLTGPIRAPEVLADGVINDHYYLVTAPLPLTIADVPAADRSLTPAEALGPGVVYRRAHLRELGQVQGVLRVLATAAAAPQTLLEATRALAQRIARSNVIVPVADLWHGDFVPWNLGRDADGSLWLFDWETAELDPPAGLDTLHWFANASAQHAPTDLTRRVRHAAQRATTSLRALGHSEGGTVIVTAWYAVTLIARAIALAETLGGWQRVQLRPEALNHLLDWSVEHVDSVSKGSEDA